jgi:hypothetical protein
MLSCLTLLSLSSITPCTSGPGVLLYTTVYGMFDLRVSGQYLTGWSATWAWAWTVEGRQVTVE